LEGGLRGDRGLSPGVPLAAEAPRLAMEELKKELMSKGATMAD